MVEVVVEQVANAGGVEGAELDGGAVDGFVGLAAEGVGGVAVVEFAEDVGARGVPTSTTNWWRSGARISVRARSKVWVARGPVCIEVQKQVGADWVQFTATMKMRRRRAW